MRLWILLAFVCATFCLAASAEAGCGRGRKVGAAAKGVAGKVVNGVRRVLPPWGR